MEEEYLREPRVKNKCTKKTQFKIFKGVEAIGTISKAPNILVIPSEYRRKNPVDSGYTKVNFKYHIFQQFPKLYELQ